MHTTDHILFLEPPPHNTSRLQVEVLAWHVKPGDRVAQFDKLLEVQSDKATVDITSRYDGVIASLKYAVGEMAPTGKPLLEIDVAEDGAVSDGTPAASSAAAASAAGVDDGAFPAASGRDGGDAAAGSGDLRSLATPAVRRLAREHDLALTSIAGTGKDGRVTKEDVLRHLDGAAAGGAAVEAHPSSPRVGAGTAMGLPRAGAAPVATPLAPQHVAPAQPRPSSPSRTEHIGIVGGATPVGGASRADRHVPVRGIQKAMVKSMTAAWAAPHFGLCEEIVVDALMELRTALRPTAEARGLKFTFLPLLLKAASLTLDAHPELNAVIAADASEVTYSECACVCVCVCLSVCGAYSSGVI